MKYTTKRNISLIIAFIFLLGALFVFFILVWPTLGEIRELNKKLAQERKHYQNQLQSVEIARSIIEQYKNLLPVSQTISLTLPRDPELQNLIKQLETISQESRIFIQNINFEKTTSLLIQSTNQELTQPYQTLTINLNLVGSYQDFKTWLNAIETNMRLMDVFKISLSPIISEGQKFSDNFNFNVVLKTYYQ